MSSKPMPRRDSKPATANPATNATVPPAKRYSDPKDRPMPSDNKTFIEEALRYASQEARYFTADALFCHLHNTGQALDGNTEANDVVWMARNLWEHQSLTIRRVPHFENLPDEERVKWEEIAALCLKVMPRLQQRIANRLILLSKVMEEIERAERRAYQRKTNPKVEELQKYIRALEVENDHLAQKVDAATPD